MSEMPRPRPPFLHRETNRHGRTIWYVRVGKGKRVRIRAEFGTDQFKTEYEAAVSGSPITPAGKTRNGSLKWLIDRYRETAAWAALSAATKKQRDRIFSDQIEKNGTEPCMLVTKAAIVAARDRRKDTPAQARNFLDAMRGLFRWAKQADLVKDDPTEGVDNPPRPRSGGFPDWTEEDVAAYEARWPIGTKERVWLDVLLYTGLRRGDAVRFGRQHVRDGVGTLKTEKSGFSVMVTLPILPVLQKTLDAGPVGDLTFIAGERGRPLVKEAFGTMFRGAARAAGVEKSAHGIRKIAATRAANNGATVAELEAIFGWSGGGMASLYTRQADRARLAKQAIGKLAKNEPETSKPAPSDRVRASERKA